MTTTALSTRRVRGIHAKGGNTQQLLRGKGSNLPEYLERTEVETVIAAVPNPMAKLLMLEQWRDGLRVSEALALVKRDRAGKSQAPGVMISPPTCSTAEAL